MNLKLRSFANPRPNQASLATPFSTVPAGGATGTAAPTMAATASCFNNLRPHHSANVGDMASGMERQVTAARCRTPFVVVLVLVLGLASCSGSRFELLSDEVACVYNSPTDNAGKCAGKNVQTVDVAGTITCFNAYGCSCTTGYTNGFVGDSVGCICDFGYYGAAGGTCTKCPDGTTSTVGSNADVTKCNLCGPGYYGLYVSSPSDCTICQNSATSSGQATPGVGTDSSSCVANRATKPSDLGNTATDKPWAGGTGTTTYVSDPDPTQSLTALENSALADLYTALIKGSPAEAQFHSNWKTLLDSATSNLCGLYGLWYQFVKPDEFPFPLDIDDTRGWCGKSSSNVKTLNAIDLDLIPTTAEQSDKIPAGEFYLAKNPGQVIYLSDVNYCHSRNWYAMIAMQKASTKDNFVLNWAADAVGKPQDSVKPPTGSGLLPQTKCLMSYNPQGILPSSLTLLTSLSSLRLRMLGIAKQPIPTLIGNMIGLTTLDLAFNSFTSTLPKSLFSLTNLVELRLNDNLLSGTLSSLIGQLVNLKILEIGYHAYSAHEYEEYGAVPQSAEGSNALSGSLPTELCLLTNLRRLKVNNNQITGQLPSCMSQMTALRLLDVSFNNLQGKLPTFYSPVASTARSTVKCKEDSRPPWSKLFLLLHNNAFTGTLDSLAYLARGRHAGLTDGFGCTTQEYSSNSGMNWISIRGNQFQGTIPSFLDAAVLPLGQLDLSFNKLVGSIPYFLSKQGSVLFSLNLASNLLTGKMPDATSKFYDKLQSFDFSSNLLTGPLPAGLFSYAMGVKSLSLRNNRLKQDIGEVLNVVVGQKFYMNWASATFSTLDLSGNSFYGMLPAGAMFLPVYETLSSKVYVCGIQAILLGNNQISGPIPPSIGLLSALTSLDLSGNKLSSTIPSQALSKLTNIQTLRLADNPKLGQPLGDTSPILCGFYYGLAMNVILLRTNQGNPAPPAWSNPCIGGVLPCSNAAAFPGLTCSNGVATGIDLTLYPNLGVLVPTSLFSSLAGIKGLEGINAASINLQGSLPIELGDVAIGSLTSLNLANNALLTGAIPDSLCKLTKLASAAAASTGLTCRPSCLAAALFPEVTQICARRVLSASSSNEPAVSSINFAKTMSNLQLIDVTNTAVKLTEIQTDVFPPSLQTLTKMSDNCYSNRIPANICEKLPKLQTVALDGLLTDNLKTLECEAPYWSSGNAFGFNGKHYVQSSAAVATIPSCLFALTGIKILHLSMGGFQGTLPEVVSDSLQELVLSHNQLSGTIPLAFQKRKWTKLDLSYNSFSGDISRMQPPAANGGTLNLAVNHLSGESPSQLQKATNVSILEGNLFTCNGGDRKLLPVNDPYLENFTCGSDNYNSSLYTCAAVVAVGLGLLFYFSFLGGEKKGLLATSVQSWRILTCGLHANDPAKEEAVAVGVAAVSDEGVGAGVGVGAAEQKMASGASSATGQASPGSVRVLQLYHLAVALLNVGTVTLVNVLFVIVQQRFGNQVQTATKTALSIFKILWNSVLLIQLDSMTLPGLNKTQLVAAHKAVYGSRGTFLALLLVYNNIFAPLFASAVADVNCFRDFVYHASTVAISYFYEKCESVSLTSRVA